MKVPYSSGTIIYRWACAECGASHEELRHFSFGAEIWQPSLPEGWKLLVTDPHFPNTVYCPKHTLVHLVDGRVIL